MALWPSISKATVALPPPTERKDAVSRRHSAGPNYQFAGAPYAPPLGELDLDKAVDHAWGRVIWVYRAIDARAKNASRLTVRVNDGRGISAKEIENHPLSILLNRQANRYETGPALRYRLHTLLDLSKRGVFVEVVPSRGGGISELHLLNPKHTWPIPDPDTFVSGFEMRLPSGETFTLPPYKEGKGGVLWIKRPHPVDPYSSSTWLDAAGISIDLDHYARVYNRNFLYNDGRPGGVIMVKGEDGIDEEDAAILQARMSGGPNVAGRVTIMEGEGLDYVDLATTPRDAQYVESRALTKGEILAAAGTPESLWNASGRTFDNADAELEGFWRNEMVPEVEMVASYWEYLTKGGIVDDTEVVSYAWEAISVLNRDEREQEARESAEFTAGTISLDEYRTNTGKEPLDLPGSRVVWLTAGKAPVGAPEDVAAILGQGQPPPDGAPPEQTPPEGTPPDQPPPVQGSGGGSPPSGEPAPTGDTLTGTGDPLGDALLAGIETKALTSGKDKFAKQRAAQGALVDAHIAALSDEIATLFRRQEKIILTRLTGAKARKHTRHWVSKDGAASTRELKALDPKYVVDRSRWIDEVVKAIADVVRAAFGAAGNFMLAHLTGEQGFDAGDAAAETIAKTVRIIAEGFDARAGHLQKIVADGDASGKTVEAIADDIREAFTHVDTWAEVTSRQVVAAMNSAQVIAATQAGAVKKRWLATDDERTRDTHREAEGQIVDLAKPFTVGAGKLLFPGDPTGPIEEWINCRCTQLFQTAERDFDAELDVDLAELDAYEGKGLIGRVGGSVGHFIAANVIFDPDAHPRDNRGRFVDTPNVVLPDGSVGVAVGANDDGSVIVAKPSGAVVTYPGGKVSDPPKTTPAKPSSVGFRPLTGGIIHPNVTSGGDKRRAAATAWAAESGIADWETTKPWDASKEDVIAGRVPGIQYDRDAVRGFTAHWVAWKDPVGIVVNDTFFDGNPDSLRALLYHEAGHAVGGEVSVGRDMNDVLADFRSDSAAGFTSPFGSGLNTGTGGYGRGNHDDQPSEILADAYMALASGSGAYYKGEAVDRLFAEVAAAADRLGFPVRDRNATPRETFDEYRKTEGNLWERRPTDVHGIRIQRDGRKYRWNLHAGVRPDGTERNDRGDATTLAAAKEAADAAYARLADLDITPVPDDQIVNPSTYTLGGDVVDVPTDVAERPDPVVRAWVDAHRADMAAAGLPEPTSDLTPEQAANLEGVLDGLLGRTIVAPLASTIVNPSIATEPVLEPVADNPKEAIFRSGEHVYTLEMRDTRRKAHSLPPKVVAKDERGHGLGFMTWHPPGTLTPAQGMTDPEQGIIGSIFVHIDHRRRGLASAMLAFARQQHPEDNIVHSTNLTDAGEAWSIVNPRLSDEGGLRGTLSTLLTGIAEAAALFDREDDTEPGSYEVLADAWRPERLPVPDRFSSATFRARRDIPTVRDLIKDGMSPADAREEWRRRYEAAKDTVVAASTAADRRAAKKAQVADIMQGIAEQADDGAPDGGLVPKAIYGLSFQEAVDIRKSGSRVGPGAVTPSDSQFHTWTVAASRLNDGDIVPARNLTLHSRPITSGYVTKRNGMPYLVADGTDLTPETIGPIVDAMEQAWIEASADLPESEAQHTNGLAWSGTVYPADKPGTFVEATAGDGTIAVWSMMPHTDLYRHELGHNVDAAPIKSGQAKHTKTREWADAVRADRDNWTPPTGEVHQIRERRNSDPLLLNADGATSPTAYGNTNEMEDFAESMRLYLLDRNHGTLGYTTNDGQDADLRFADLYPGRAAYFDRLMDSDGPTGPDGLSGDVVHPHVAPAASTPSGDTRDFGDLMNADSTYKEWGNLFLHGLDSRHPDGTPKPKDEGFTSHEYVVTEEDRVAAKMDVVSRIVERMKDDDFPDPPTPEVFDDGTVDPDTMKTHRRDWVSHLIAQWATTANDNDPMSLALQEEAADLFGVSNSMPWTMHSHLVREVAAIREANGPMYRAFLQAQYDETQAYLAEHGITELPLWRGFRWEKVNEDPPSWISDPTGEIPLRPLSAFTVDPVTATRFATGWSDHRPKDSAVISGTIPASRILALPRTGIGCLHEWEVVIINGPGNWTILRDGWGKPE